MPEQTSASKLDQAQLKTITDKMDQIIRLLALTALKDEVSEQEKIRLLDSMGFRQVEIARILGKKPDNINMVIRRLKKKTETVKGRTSTADSEASGVISPER